ncbi:type II toxin-antitoxin system VapC family toxin [Geminicoccus harenae]|uniref:type II toxin-antitoxin system VapC family toxin n=1 Tax=Geminicoccus harenae TaxID=2498453 RepID=UPI00168AC538|nr:type II toxin-antitoxin system VapC family toxin [Geminicoccus harenae]
MSACVLDSSAALAWVLPGEDDERADRLLDLVSSEGALVPDLWLLEVANVLLMAERRGRITLAERRQALATLRELPVQVEPCAARSVWGDVLELAAGQGLTVYDATYLELALRHNLPLASFDRQLRQAAGTVGVPLLG